MATTPGLSHLQIASGPWRGYYEQWGERSPQDQTMEFADGMVRGDGADSVGEFHIEGSYRDDEGTLRIGWIKTYANGHSVLYLGTYDGAWIHGEYALSGSTPHDRFGIAPARLVASAEDWR